MSEKLNFGLKPSVSNGHHLVINVPVATWARLNAIDEHAKGIEFLTRKRTSALVVDGGDTKLHLLVNEKRIGSSEHKPRLLHNLVQLIDGLETHTLKDDQDPDFQVQMGASDVNGTGRHMIDMQVTWPNLADEILQKLVSDTMVSTATNLKYDVKRFIPRIVYAQIRRQYGVTLETNPIGSCSVGTDGMWYEPSERTIELQAHNIYNNTQQIILLAGGVALARAETLVTA